MRFKLTIIFSVLSILSLIAQDKRKLTFGVKGGVNYSNVYKIGLNFYHSVYKDSYKLGYQIGGFAEVEVISKLAFRPELVFSSQGQKAYANIYELQSFPDELKEITVVENYIILPLLIKLEPFTNFNILFGPQLDYLFYIKEKKYLEDISTFSDNLFKPGLSTSIVGGVGYDFTSKLGVDLRYDLGFERNKGHTYPKTLEIRNSVFSLNVN